MIKKENTLKPLKISFKEGVRNNSFLFTQVKRSERLAIYHITYPLSGIHVGYEVFFIKHVRQNNFLSKEKYPSDKDFGKTAFSFGTLEMANWCFEKMQNGDTK